MITVSHLEKDFKKVKKGDGLSGSFKALFKPEYETFEAVKDLSFEIPEGEIFGFIGANGAGKSTTIKMLTGILTPTSGFIEINGKNPQKDRQSYVKDIGVVFGQRTQLWWDLPLEDTYKVLKEIYEVPEEDFVKRMNFLNDVLDLNEFIKDPVRTLSLGQRMRADIAASLLHNPKVLFLDEPTIGLDVDVKDRIRNAIKKINQEEKTTIILTTHDLNDIEQLCSRIFMIDKGKEIFDGSAEELKEKFGNIHEITFKLNQLEDLEKLHYEEDFSDVLLEQEDKKIKVRFDASKNSASEILQYTLNNVSVLDVSIKEADIEDIIRRFYRKELKDA